jgi:hypothetical protein
MRGARGVLYCLFDNFSAARVKAAQKATVNAQNAPPSDTLRSHSSSLALSSSVMVSSRSASFRRANSSCCA